MLSEPDFARLRFLQVRLSRLARATTDLEKLEVIIASCIDDWKQERDQLLFEDTH